MPIFQYKAINPNGNSVSGELEADTIDTAKGILAARGYIPERVAEKGGSSIFDGRLQGMLSPVRPLDLILFTKQLRTMIKAGVPIVHLLQVLENQTENRRLKRVIGKMAADIQAGAGLNETFKKHPGIFSMLYCSMIEAGEKSGSLVTVLERLIYIIEHENKVKSDIKAALRYPMFVALFLGVAFVVLLTFVIPKFITIFSKAGLDLPLPTRICLILYQFVHQYWPAIIMGAIGVVTILSFYTKTPGGKLLRDALMLKLPSSETCS